MGDLLPCPFCGGTEIKLNGTQRPYWYAECQKCGVSDGLCHTKDEAHKSWNTRSEDKGGEAVAWAWRTSRGVLGWAKGWSLSHNEPTRENCHLKDGDEIEVRRLGFIDTHPPRATAVEDARDAARVDFLMRAISGRELRQLGIVYGDGSLDSFRVAIDAALSAHRGEDK